MKKQTNHKSEKRQKRPQSPDSHVQWPMEIIALVQEALTHIDQGDVTSLMTACDALSDALDIQSGDQLLLHIRDGLLMQLHCTEPVASAQENGAMSLAASIDRARAIVKPFQKAERKQKQANKPSPKPRRRAKPIEELVARIAALPEDFHMAGSVPGAVLNGIVKHCGTSIANSVETGSGRTTLLFSHLSKSHKVFAVEGDNRSITSVRTSDLLNKKTVKFIEGPTQVTLRRQKFRRKLQVVLLDGPHGYPFPDMEYYHLYPHIENGGILIIDDIHIPTIHNLYAFLKEDEMWEFIEVIDKTAFFRRTDAPLFHPLCDGWNLQKYNTRRFPVQIDQ
jgi:hypothetical protein